LSERRRLSGLALLALAVILAWGGTVDPTKAWARWLGVAALGSFGMISLFFDRMRWLPARDRIESAYLQMMMAGVAIGAVAWLIPSTGSRALLVVAGLLVVVPLGLWIRIWLRNRQTDHDDSHHPR
jgi:hypothetical protein